MELYTTTAYELSRQLTLRYSTSFGKSSQLFSKEIQPHIFAIYGLVRIGDEIVDTYTGDDKQSLLAALHDETHAAITRGYSTNPIVHAFALTAQQYGIDDTLIDPFFESMAYDLVPQIYTDELYRRYIYGSAEVIGLMCLKVFVNGDADAYEQLRPGASALGAGYQKVNFLRDIASDFDDRGRVYFPDVEYATFDDATKQQIIDDIAKDFAAAAVAIPQLPSAARKAVSLSYRYYQALLDELKKTPAAVLKTTRIRVPDSKKFALLIAEQLNRQRSKQ